MKFDAARQPFSMIIASSGLLSLLFAARYFISPSVIETPRSTAMPLAGLLTKFSATYPMWSSLIILLLLIWIIYIIIQLTARYASATSRNYLPIPIFIISACGIYVPGEALASYTAALLLVLSIRQFISTFSKEYRFAEAFRGGFYLGLIPLIYAPAIILLLLVPLLIAIYQRSTRELVVSVSGALLPTLGAWFILWASGEDIWFLFTELWRNISVSGGSSIAAISVTAAICVGLIVILVFWSIVWFLANRKGMRTRQRKVMLQILLTFILLAVSLAIPGSSFTAGPLLSVPAAMAVPYAFTGKHTFASSAIYCLIIATVLALNILPLFGVSAF